MVAARNDEARAGPPGEGPNAGQGCFSAAGQAWTVRVLVEP